MLARGWIAEVRALLRRYPPTARAFGSVGYAQIVEHVRQGTPLEETHRRIGKATRMYARRQRTWFRSEPGIGWRTDAATLASPAGIARVRRFFEEASESPS